MTVICYACSQLGHLPDLALLWSLVTRQCSSRNFPSSMDTCLVALPPLTNISTVQLSIPCEHQNKMPRASWTRKNFDQNNAKAKQKQLIQCKPMHILALIPKLPFYSASWLHSLTHQTMWLLLLSQFYQKNWKIIRRKKKCCFAS